MKLPITCLLLGSYTIALGQIGPFHTRGNQLIDPCGKAVVLKGVNKMVYFDGADSLGALSFREIAKTGANCVRITWQMRRDADLMPTSTTRLDQIITNAKANKLIPIVGLWDFVNATDGGFSHLPDYVAYWTRPDVMAVIQKHRNALIVNIADEAATGDETNAADLDTFANAYKTAVRQLRTAGIGVPLMIDGMDRGKSLLCFVAKGPDMLADDPDHNLIFSFHPYWPKAATDASSTFIQDAFNAVRPLPITVIMGEMSKYGASADSTTDPCSPAGLVDYRQFVRLATAQNMGWLLWEWGPGNGHYAPDGTLIHTCPNMDMTSNRLASTIGKNRASGSTPDNAWAAELVNMATFSIKRTAKKTFFINSGFKTCPTP